MSSSTATDNAPARGVDPRPTEEETISITFHSQDGDQLVTKIKPNMNMRVLLRNYCLRKNFEYRVMKFLVDGEFFDHRKTAAQIGLKDGDQIDAMLPQSGGRN